MKKTTNSQLIGQRGEHAAAAQTLAMGFTFQGFNRLETGIDAFLELREPQTGTMLAKWIGAQIKTTEGLYSYENAEGFEFLLNPADLEYWRNSNIPVILILVRLDAGDIYWQTVDADASDEPRRLRLDKKKDRFVATRPIASPPFVSREIVSVVTSHPWFQASPCT